MTAVSREKFQEYNIINPHIYKEFERLALQMVEHRSHFSSKAIIEKMRWDSAISQEDTDYKLSAWITPYLTRKFDEEHPEHKGFFRKARLRGDQLEERE